MAFWEEHIGLLLTKRKNDASDSLWMATSYSEGFCAGWPSPHPNVACFLNTNRHGRLLRRKGLHVHRQHWQGRLYLQTMAFFLSSKKSLRDSPMTISVMASSFSWPTKWPLTGNLPTKSYLLFIYLQATLDRPKLQPIGCILLHALLHVLCLRGRDPTAHELRMHALKLYPTPGGGWRIPWNLSCFTEGVNWLFI